MDLKQIWKEKKWRKWKKEQWLIVFLVGVLLLVIALPTGNSKKQSESADSNTETSGQQENASGQSGGSAQNGQDAQSVYEAKLEQRLTAILEQVAGVGKVKVMITLKDSGQTVLEKDVQSTENQTSESDDAGGSRTINETQREESTVYEQGNETGAPVVSKELRPEVEGVLVVAQGGGNASVAENISDAVLALFDVEVHKIKIVKMSMQEGT